MRMARVPETQTPKPALASQAEDFDAFEATLEKGATIQRGSHGLFEEENEKAQRKSSFIPVLITVILLIIVIVGGYYGYVTHFGIKKEPTPVPATMVEQPKQETLAATATQAPSLKPQESVAAAAKAATTSPEQEKEVKKPALVKAKVKKHEAAAPKKHATEAPAVASISIEQPKQVAETAPTPAKPAIAFIASNPIFADVYIDGKLVGKTNTEIKIASGTHAMRFVKGDKEFTQQMTFHPGKNPTQFVRLQ